MQPTPSISLELRLNKYVWYFIYVKDFEPGEKCIIDYTIMFFVLSSYFLDYLVEFLQSLHIITLKVANWTDTVLWLKLSLKFQKRKDKNFQKCFNLLETFTRRWNV